MIKTYPDAKLARRAESIWRRQKDRNQVDYSLAEFILWYSAWMLKFKFKKPHVGRIDHSKGYFFGNIVLQEAEENIKERNDRLGLPDNRKKVVIWDLENEKSLDASSLLEASKITGMTPGSICRHIQRAKNSNPTEGRYKFMFGYPPCLL